MAGEVEFIADGTVTSPQGYVAGGVYAGLKSQGDEVADLGILMSQRPASVAATFSTSSIVSPSVTVSRQRVAGGTAR